MHGQVTLKGGKEMTHKQSYRLLSALLTAVLLIGLLPAAMTPSLAALKDPSLEVVTSLAFKTKPQNGTAIKTDGSALTLGHYDVPCGTTVCSAIIKTLQSSAIEENGITQTTVDVAVVLFGNLQGSPIKDGLLVSIVSAIDV